MPFMAGGSCLHMLKAFHPEGFEEVVIATILREVLKALEYLHRHGHIHCVIKAGNILIGDHGAIKLGDLGVSACLFDSGDRQRARKDNVQGIHFSGHHAGWPLRLWSNYMDTTSGE
ncbi:putative protein kinase STE-STE20-Fray family [Helianthus debilis subsp. tardiflorus]